MLRKVWSDPFLRYFVLRPIVALTLALWSASHVGNSEAPKLIGGYALKQVQR